MAGERERERAWGVCVRDLRITLRCKNNVLLVDVSKVDRREQTWREK